MQKAKTAKSCNFGAGTITSYCLSAFQSYTYFMLYRLSAIALVRLLLISCGTSASWQHQSSAFAVLIKVPGVQALVEGLT